MYANISSSVLVAFLTFAFVSSITPGPNMIMLLAAGANFGFRRSLPHMLGVILGFGLMVLLVGLGLAAVLAQFPVLFAAARIAGIGYLIYLAIRIARADKLGTSTAHAKPMTFVQAAAFQWANPKAWSMAISAVTAYAPADHAAAAVPLYALLFVAIGVPCASFWTGLGVAVQRGLSHPRALRAFNLTMAALLLLSLYPMVRSELPQLSGVTLQVVRADTGHLDRWPAHRPLQ